LEHIWIKKKKKAIAIKSRNNSHIGLQISAETERMANKWYQNKKN